MHGLGNPEGNALPTCQMIKIWGHVNQFPFPIREAGFWIDTIGVPVTGVCRKLSIQRMGSIYSNAGAVLVLDDELQQTGIDPIEQTIRLSSSTWQRRLWTLQEGCLNAERVYIQFFNGAIPFHTVIDNVLRHPSNNFSTVSGKAHDPLTYLYLVGNYRSALSNDITYGDDESLSSYLFLFLLENLSWRTTTRASDEPLCIATILGMDTAPLLELSGSEERMELFFRSLPRVPQDLLFFGGPKMSSSSGLGWASKSFLEKDWHPFARHQWTSPTPRGLPVIADGIILTLSRASATNEDGGEQGDGCEPSALSPEKDDVFNPRNIIALGHPPTMFLLRDCTVAGVEGFINLFDIPDPALIFREETDHLYSVNTKKFACLVSVNRTSSSTFDTSIPTSFRSLVLLEEVKSISKAGEKAEIRN